MSFRPFRDRFAALDVFQVVANGFPFFSGEDVNKELAVKVIGFMEDGAPKEARGIIETAFLQIYQARTQQQDIQHGLRYPQSEILKPRGVERVLTYHGD